jgi:hypothetical protein
LPRKRGGQPGNQNALRHGFYSKAISADEHTDLDLIITDALDNEIHLIRCLIRRTVEFSEGISDWRSSASLLSSIASSSQQLSGMIYKRYLLAGNADVRSFNTLNEVLSELRAENFMK